MELIFQEVAATIALVIEAFVVLVLAYASAEAVAGMQAEMRQAFASDEIKSTWTSLGTELPNTWGADMGQFVSAEVRRWAEVVKSSGAKLD